jgi:hypothetical protein
MQDGTALEFCDEHRRILFDAQLRVADRTEVSVQTKTKSNESVIGAVMPAFRAARLDPVVALSSQ